MPPRFQSQGQAVIAHEETLAAGDGDGVSDCAAIHPEGGGIDVGGGLEEPQRASTSKQGLDLRDSAVVEPYLAIHAAANPRQGLFEGDSTSLRLVGVQSFEQRLNH